MKVPSVKISGTFVRYFVSFLVIFFIPLAFSYVAFNIHYINLYKQEVFNNSTSQVINMKNAFDFQLDQISSLTKQFTMDKEFQPGFNTDEFNRLDTVKRLNSYNAVNDFIFEVIYFQKNLNTAVSSQHILQLDTMDSFYFHYIGWPASEIRENLFNIKAPVWRPFETIEMADKTRLEVLTYIYPFIYSSAGSSNLFLFQIERESFEKTLGMDNKKNINIIFDNTGNLIYSSVNNPEKYYDILKPYTAASPGSVQREEVGKLFIASAVSEKNGWKFFTLLPSENVLEKVKSLQRNYVLINILLFLLGSILIFAFTTVNYNPLKALVVFIERNLGSYVNAGNDIDKVKKALNYLDESNHVLKEKLGNSAGLVKPSLLWSLLCDKFGSSADFNHEASVYGICYQKPCFFIAIFSFNHQNAQPNAHLMEDRFITFIEGRLQPNFDAYGFKNPDNNFFIFVCSSIDENNSFLCDTFSQIIEELHSKFGLLSKVGISSFAQDISILYRKYIEAIHTIEYLNSEKECSLVFYSKEMFDYNMNYPGEEIEELRKALISFDVTAFNSIFLMLQNIVENSKLSMFMKICICYDIINTIIKTLLVIEKDAARILQKYNHILYDRNKTLDKLAEILNSICADVTEYMSGAVDYKENNLIDNIKTYIEVHLLDQDFSLQKVADYFQLSLSNLSHYYKANTGQLLSEYAADMKMNYAKDLLKNTDTSLNEIMHKTGYTSMSSFIRKFKGHSGTTPGEYRAIFRKNG